MEFGINDSSANRRGPAANILLPRSLPLPHIQFALRGEPGAAYSLAQQIRECSVLRLSSREVLDASFWGNCSSKTACRDALLSPAWHSPALCPQVPPQPDPFVGAAPNSAHPSIHRPAAHFPALSRGNLSQTTVQHSLGNALKAGKALWPIPVQCCSSPKHSPSFCFCFKLCPTLPYKHAAHMEWDVVELDTGRFSTMHLRLVQPALQLPGF